MSKRNFIILIIVLLILLMVGAYFFVSKSNSGTGTDGKTSLKDFFPFGKGSGVTPSPTPEPQPSPTPEPQPEPTPVVMKLRAVSKTPTAGYTLFSKERLVPVTITVSGDTTTTTASIGTTEKIEAARYVERATGNIYDVFGDTLEEHRISNTTIPRIYEALFGNSGTLVIMRYVGEDNRTIQTYEAPIPEPIIGGDGATPELTGTFMATNISDATISPDTTKLFTLAPFVGTIIGTLSNADGTSKKQIFSSQYLEWLPAWIDSKQIALTTKASAYSAGYLYFLDTGTQKTSRILGNITGLTTLVSPDGKLVLYSQTSGNTIRTLLYNTTTRVAQDVGLKTLPEKCLWTSDSSTIYCGVPNDIQAGSYPDAWYQGLTRFDDSLWRITVGEINTTTLLVSLREVAGSAIDTIKLKLASDAHYLYFIDKTNGILWQYDLTI